MLLPMVTPGVEPEVNPEVTAEVLLEVVLKGHFIDHIVMCVWSQHISQMNVLHFQIVRLKEINYWIVVYVKIAQDRNMRENANSNINAHGAMEHT